MCLIGSAHGARIALTAHPALAAHIMSATKFNGFTNAQGLKEYGTILVLQQFLGIETFTIYKHTWACENSTDPILHKAPIVNARHIMAVWITVTIITIMIIKIAFKLLLGQEKGKSFLILPDHLKIFIGQADCGRGVDSQTHD